MSYEFDPTTNEIRLKGDGFGWSTATRLLAAPPAGAKRMQFAFRAYYQTAAGGALPNYDATEYNLQGWNQCAHFGFAWDNTEIKYPASSVANPTPYAPNFYGWINRHPPKGNPSWPPIAGETVYQDVAALSTRSVDLNAVTRAWTKHGPDHYNTGGAKYGYVSFMNGIGGEFFANVYVNTAETLNLALPSNPTDGAAVTGMWEVWASAIDKTMYSRMGMNGATLAGDAMFTALDAAGTSLRSNTIHGDVTSLFRTDFDTVNFPRYLKLRFPGVSTHQMIFKTGRVRWLSYNGTVLGTDTVP